MVKLSHSMTKAALAALLAAGLAGSAAVTLTPAAVHAQPYGYYDEDGYYHPYPANWDDQYRADWYRDHPDWYRYHPDYDDRGWIGIGVPGFGIGIYDNYPYYRHYCSDYDYYHGYCS